MLPVPTGRVVGVADECLPGGLDPYAHLRHLFEELPKASTAEALEALLPWNVKAPSEPPALPRREPVNPCFSPIRSA